MTEDILFDNIYIGHSVEDAKKLADETYFVKHAIEEAAEKAAAKVDEDEEETAVTFKEDPVTFIRSKVFTFVEAAKVDPLNAFKTQPETGAAIAVTLVTFFGMIGALLGLVGGSQPAVTKVCHFIALHIIFELTYCCYSRLRRLMLPLLMTRKRKRKLPLPQQAARSLPIPPLRSGSKPFTSFVG